MAARIYRLVGLGPRFPLKGLREGATMPSGLRQVGILIAVVLLWQLYVTASGVPALLVAPPTEVARALATDLGNLRIPAAAVRTVEALMVGMLLGMASGFLLASLAILHGLGRDLLGLLSAILNPLPGIAILPLAMIWFGLTPTAVIFIVVHSTMWPIAINTDTGFRTISPTLQMVGRNLGIRGPRLVAEILLPAALPSILSGLKSAWAFGWRTVVAAELVFGVAGEAGGLGWYINSSRYFLNTANVFAGLVVISLLGLVVDFAFTLVERETVVRWGMKRAV